MLILFGELFIFCDYDISQGEAIGNNWPFCFLPFSTKPNGLGRTKCHIGVIREFAIWCELSNTILQRLRLVSTHCDIHPSLQLRCNKCVLDRIFNDGARLGKFFHKRGFKYLAWLDNICYLLFPWKILWNRSWEVSAVPDACCIKEGVSWFPKQRFFQKKMILFKIF